jgi:hypothetical protein
MKYSWADQHEEDDEMETVEYAAGNMETTPLPIGGGGVLMRVPEGTEGDLSALIQVEHCYCY